MPPVGKHSSAWCPAGFHEPSQKIRRTKVSEQHNCCGCCLLQKAQHVQCGCGCPVDTSAEGRNTDRADRRDHAPVGRRQKAQHVQCGCGCPVDTSAEGRSTDRADRRDHAPVGHRQKAQLHSGGTPPAGFHEPSQKNTPHKSVRVTQLLWLLLTAKSPSTQRRDAAPPLPLVLQRGKGGCAFIGK